MLNFDHELILVLNRVNEMELILSHIVKATTCKGKESEIENAIAYNRKEGDSKLASITTLYKFDAILAKEIT